MCERCLRGEISPVERNALASSSLRSTPWKQPTILHYKVLPKPHNLKSPNILQSSAHTSNFMGGPRLPSEKAGRILSTQENPLCPEPRGLPSLITLSSKTLGRVLSTSHPGNFLSRRRGAQEKQQEELNPIHL